MDDDSLPRVKEHDVTNGAVGLQLDLFGQVLSAEQLRFRDALTCLRDAVSEALEVVVELEYKGTRDNRSIKGSGSWVYCVCRAGVRFETRDFWWSGARERGEVWGFDRTPALLLRWAELTELIEHDPRRLEVAAWVESLPWPRWRELTRPFEMWPNPGGGDPGWVLSDHESPHWTARRRAWDLVVELLTDAIERVARA